ncbi:hypothetical protein CA223_16500 [Sphingomonas koreensis]|jgi:hypothetical protein|uniref:DUF6438 domain-containing protein n=1 Tax=Sphingomonas koreensis TaxID=93064 RepID=A0A1L6J5L8_9SPHN|nr:DUF6438 domain-containing protein [Sphingomonas koreensis]APR51195.1 hypothetical protein BRX40_01010 [Sphingomonas koreensis]MDC7810491.1 DUF6438 domain-containing protein [Sphingomonas koreensis]RSU17514.1 hypothetical protein CA224_21000 [Sphingomonas koreensis]RSU19944.1 hypothetical protein CA222_21680 [Sphingomonas koreensis]RSU26110.1 hypothetical protein CA225_13800 [Sphingomonas koreensis]
MKRIAILLAGLGTSACIPQVSPPGGSPRPPVAPRPQAPPPYTPRPPETPKPPVSGEAIEYQTGPCFGSCPVYRFQVNPNGTGNFTGIRFTAVTGQRSFRVTPQQAAALAQSLAPWRPATGRTRRYAHGEPGCERAATDMPSAEIRWRGRRSTTTLYFDFGCDRDANHAMAAAIGNAPDLIPALAPLIGARP